MPDAVQAADPGDDAARHPTGRRRRLSRALAWACWAYAAALAALALLIHGTADRWWVGTVAMFGPRWLWSIPLAFLLPAAALVRRRSVLLPLAAAVVVLVGPVMGLCVPWRRVLLPAPAGPSLRIATLNADLGDLDADALRHWVGEARPDVVVLQACFMRDRQAVFEDGSAGTWHVRSDGELVVASRFPISNPRVYPGLPFSGGDGGVLAAYDLQSPAGTVHLFNLHVATPRYALMAVAQHGAAGAEKMRANITRRQVQAGLTRQWVDEALAAGGRVIVAGDFNMPPDSAMYRRYWSDFTNAFTSAGFGFGNTHFTRRTSVRIDQVLAGPSWRVRHCWIGPFVGSAHRPLVADLEPLGAAG